MEYSPLLHIDETCENRMRVGFRVLFDELTWIPRCIFAIVVVVVVFAVIVVVVVVVVVVLFAIITSCGLLSACVYACVRVCLYVFTIC